MKREKGSPEEIHGLMNLAKEDLKIANFALKEGFYRQSIVSSYYVTLSSSRALLLEKGFLPKSHSGVFTMLGLHIIKQNLLPKTYSAEIKKLFRERLSANYSGQRDFTQEEAEEAIEFAEKFYEKVLELIGK